MFPDSRKNLVRNLPRNYFADAPTILGARTSQERSSEQHTPATNATPCAAPTLPDVRMSSGFGETAGVGNGVPGAGLLSSEEQQQLHAARTAFGRAA